MNIFIEQNPDGDAYIAKCGRVTSSGSSVADSVLNLLISMESVAISVKRHGKFVEWEWRKCHRCGKTHEGHLNPGLVCLDCYDERLEKALKKP